MWLVWGEEFSIRGAAHGPADAGWVNGSHPHPLSRPSGRGGTKGGKGLNPMASAMG
jgi:hypothetical protein